MADICPVCEKKMFFSRFSPQVGIDVEVHGSCLMTFLENPELYGGKAIEKTEDQKKYQEQQKKEKEELDKLQKEIDDKSVYVKGFSMPFGEMVEFMVKWAIASIPAFIILAIFGAIFFAMFGALFF